VTAGAFPIHHKPTQPAPDGGQGGASLQAGPPRITPLRELQLLESYRRGGQQAHQALSELLVAYQRRIYSICYRMIRNVDEASDLTQDALVKVLEGLESYDGRSKLSTWVIRVTMNCCLSHLRKAKVREHDSLEALPGGSASARTANPAEWGPSHAGGSAGSSHKSHLRGREPQPAESVQQSQTRAMVTQALDSLDVDTRAILVLRDLQDLDYQQLAEVLEVPVGTVKSRLFRARAALRETVEKLEPGSEAPNR